ncbi:MAG TPA: hypothetical protein VHV83_20655 [Armatimonadota bacterium]|nr:hypothetical protein [Armatimonadota bacterium]
MIKINLLPPYVYEARRIKITIVVFVALFLLLGGGVLGYQSGLKQQESWYGSDKTRCDNYKKTLDDYSAQADTLQTKSVAYDPFNQVFADLGPIKAYNTQLANVFIEAAQKIGGSGSWYTKLEIQSDGTMNAEGKINGSMRFLSYYFRLKDEGFTLQPAVEPFPAKKMSQQVSLKVSGKVSALPTPPALPTGASPNPWKDLYKDASSAAAAGGAPGGAPGAAPAGAPGMAAPGAPAN